MDYQKEIENVANWMKEYGEKAYADGFVIGLSGGVDSAVVAAIAAKAVGKENVLGVIMPCESAREDMLDAAMIAKHLEMPSQIVYLDEVLDSILIATGFGVKPAKRTRNNKVVVGNIKARLRMVALYKFSNEKNYIVAGTSNLSEIKTGYFTKYGDGGVDIEPVGNYYKTDIWEMAKVMELPQKTIDRVPSAGLWEGQKDSDELPPYERLDDLLRFLGGVKMNNDLTWNVRETDDLQELISGVQHKLKVPPRCPTLVQIERNHSLGRYEDSLYMETDR